MRKYIELIKVPSSSTRCPSSFLIVNELSCDFTHLAQYNELKCFSLFANFEHFPNWHLNFQLFISLVYYEVKKLFYSIKITFFVFVFIDVSRVYRTSWQGVWIGGRIWNPECLKYMVGFPLMHQTLLLSHNHWVSPVFIPAEPPFNKCLIS